MLDDVVHGTAQTLRKAPYLIARSMALRKTLYVFTLWNVAAPSVNRMFVAILKKPFIRSHPEPVWSTYARKNSSSEVSCNILP
jgi:hypothetical protein